MTLRVGLELTILELDNAGTARAVQGLRGALRERPDVELVELAHPRGRAGSVARGLDREGRWFWLGLQRALRRAKVDLVHFPTTLGPWRAPAPVVVTVNDVLALERPGEFTRGYVLQQRVAMRRLARSAKVVLCPSAWTRDRLGVVAGVAPERVRVVPYGVGPPFTAGPADPAVLRRHGVDGTPFVLAVGTLQPRKGLDAMLAAVPASHRLVVVGARGWQDDAVAAQIRRRAIPAGRVPDGELVELLRGADALVHGARQEGFGFPPLEAMACGTPVVAVRGTAISEVVGDVGELAEPDDPDGLRSALARVLEDPVRADELRAQGPARAARFTWAACAEATVAAYRDALRAP